MSRPISTKLIRLFHRRWGAAAVALLTEEGGARFVTLVNRLAVSRDTLNQTLSDLMEAGFVQRNVGYGHPLRPEYLPTELGSRIAPACASLVTEMKRQGTEDIALRKWSVPSIYLLAERGLRFSELRSALPGITARALTAALRDLREAGLIERRVLDGYPPSTLYVLTPRGKPLSVLAREIGASL